MKLRCVVTLMAVMVLGSSLVHADEALDRLDKMLLLKSPDIVQFLKKNYADLRTGKELLKVGVLKFTVVKEGMVVDKDNVGPLNMTLAHRLETALILTVKEEDGIGILQRPNVVLDKWSQKAKGQWPKSQKVLFDVDEFELAWGSGKEFRNLSADVFLTGEAKLSTDARTIEVTVRAFDRGQPEAKPVDVVTFKSSTDSRTLLETNESFLVSRGVKVTPKTIEGQPNPGQMVDSRNDIIKNPSNHPALAKDKAVRLTILYDDQKQTPRTASDGRVEVNEPKQDEVKTVAFLLENTTKDETFGVVLMVNGFNTIYHEEAEPVNCFKYILKPAATLTVTGFYERNGGITPFKVLPVAEAKQKFRFGDYFGTFRMTVFQENPEPRYALEDQSFERLSKASIPQPVLDKLKPLKSKEFTAQVEYLAAVGGLLSEKELKDFKDHLVAHADRERRFQATVEEKSEQGVRLSSLSQPEDKSQNLKTKQQTIINSDPAVLVGRSAVVKGDKTVEGSVKEIETRFIREPFDSTVIYYYQPGK